MSAEVTLTSPYEAARRSDPETCYRNASVVGSRPKKRKEPGLLPWLYPPPLSAVPKGRPISNGTPTVDHTPVPEVLSRQPEGGVPMKHNHNE
jgi:hypothetical protein